MRPASVAAPADLDHSADSSAAARAALALLRLYKLLVSPLFAGACRYSPSCSDYMSGAIRTHGVIAGSWLGVKRLCRCHPFGGHGFDPVPPRRP
jgi:putative membrane protein insertion efficiency factor